MKISPLFGLPLLALSAAACGSSTPEPELATDACPPGQYCPAPYDTAGQVPPNGAPTAGTTTPTTPPVSSTGTAAPLDLQPVTPLITMLAANEVAGMTPQGGAFGANFNTGQTLEHDFTLEPGKCYSVVGVGMPPIEELHAQIVTQPSPALAPVALAEDKRTGPQAVVGDGGNCFTSISPVPVPAKVVLQATRGSGIAGAQLYVKG